MATTEVELQCLVDEPTYARLLELLEGRGKLIEDTRQITHYFKGGVDTRVQFSKTGGKMWQKMGAMHQVGRKEYEVKMSRADAQIAFEIFKNLGFEVKVSWFRHRRRYQVGEIDVALDNTVGYGRILEVELTGDEIEIKKKEGQLREFLRELKVNPTPKNEFDKIFADYVQTWGARTSHLKSDWLDE